MSHYRVRPTLSHRSGLAALLVLLAGQSPAEEVSERFTQLTAATRWTLVRETVAGFDTFHPQGMARVGEDLFVSSVEVIDRARAQGKGHLFRMRTDGSLVAQTDLTDGARYHPGGIDFDGTRLWVPVAEYRPDSSSVVFIVDPAELRAEKLFTFPDHLGAIAHDPESGTLVGVSWGSRRFYRWQTRKTTSGGIEIGNADSPDIAPNPSHYVDFQDMQWIRGTRQFLCGGLKRYTNAGDGKSLALSGLELLDGSTLRPLHQIPVPLWDRSGLPMLQNPFEVEATAKGLRFYFMPADNDSTLFEYQVETKE